MPQFFISSYIEVLHIPMERTSGISVSLFSSAKLTEVFSSLWCYICAELKCDTTHVLPAYFHVKVNYSVGDIDDKRVWYECEIR